MRFNKEICGDCFCFRFSNSDKYGFIPNKSGIGSCKKYPQLEKINALMTPRQALEKAGLVQIIAQMEDKASCFEYYGLEMNEDELEPFISFGKN